MKTKMNNRCKILLKASMSASFAMGLLAPLYALFVQKVGGSVLDIGFAYAIFAILTGLFIMIMGNSGFFMKHVRKMVPIGYALMTIAYINYIFVKNPTQLFISQAILGIATGMLEPSWDAVFSEKLSEKQEIKNWTMWSGSINIILGISAIIGSLIISNYSFKVLFILMSVFAAISAIISLGVLRDRK